MSETRPSLASWPRVALVDEEALVRLVVPYVRWLHPDLVAQVQEDNAQYLEDWQNILRQHAIPADLYVWTGSACAFPGVRRRSGKGDEKTQSCLKFDQNGNRLAHRIWELLGASTKQFKAERAGYELVHLFPHQPDEWRKLLAESDTELTYRLPMRWREQLADWQTRLTQTGLPALFSNPANMCFLPGSLVRPTDNASLLRLVLWQKAIKLYGIAALLPPGVAEPLAGWLSELPEVAGLDWSECYHGSTNRMQHLIKERDRKLKHFQLAQP
jgi:hypothetical protein